MNVTERDVANGVAKKWMNFLYSEGAKEVCDVLEMSCGLDFRWGLTWREKETGVMHSETMQGSPGRSNENAEQLLRGLGVDVLHWNVGGRTCLFDILDRLDSKASKHTSLVSFFEDYIRLIAMPHLDVIIKMTRKDLEQLALVPESQKDREEPKKKRAL
jgi:hypothetical protein